ncbi:MAG TPA: hypothetical protein VN937_05945 [Blastocatellia bacterium]|nr:hypothetical protein [Blastocatellia bacterium]
MAIPTLANVQPGDLITAEFMNRLMDAMRSLDNRISDLESSDVVNRPPVLTGRRPTGDTEVGSLLTLIGRNFLQPGELNTVMLGGVPINQFAGGPGGSTDTELIFTVPDVFSGLPRTVPVSVTNQFGASTSLQVRLLPHVQPQGGQVVIFNQTPPLGQINAGSTFELKWLVDSQTVLPAVYNLGVNFSNVVGATAAAWQAGTVITPSGTREIPRGTPLAVSARITVPAGATSVQIALRAESVDTAIAGKSSDALSITVGATPDISDPRLLATLSAIPPFDGTVPNAAHAAGIGGVSGVEVRFGATGLIPITIHVTQDSSAAGSYSFEASVEDPAGLWQSPTVTPTGSSQAAPSDRNLSVHIQNSDTGLSTTVKFLVVRARHTNAATGANDFTSFVRFPIRGFAS